MEEAIKQVTNWLLGSIISLVIFYVIWFFAFIPLFGLPELTTEQVVVIGLVLRTLFTFSP